MAHGHDFQRAIDRLAADLTRIAERAIAAEIERALAMAMHPIERNNQRSAAARRARAGTAAQQRAAEAAERRTARAAERVRRVAEREAERTERDTERLRRKQERDSLRQELKSARDAARQARTTERSRLKQETVASREARHRALTEKAEKAAAPPPVLVFKRSRDGQVTVLQPRTVEAETPPPASA